MTDLDLSNKNTKFHFIGIGGISMSGLAELMLSEGFKVSGSDMQESSLTSFLSEKGAVISFPQSEKNITDDIDAVIYTAAIHEDNPEFMEVKRRNLPLYTRAEFLGEIMKRYPVSVAVSGTHGKTTTTSMLSEILLKADKDPTLSVGGMLKSIGGNFRVGGRDYFVTEACEYTNSFLSFHPTLSIILNVDADHLDFFKDLDDIRDSFKKFASLLPENGTLVINRDTYGFDEITEGLHARVVTFGADDKTGFHPEDISYNASGYPSFTIFNGDTSLGRAELRIPGDHNILNACAAAAAASEIGIDPSFILSGLSEFTGTERRFEHKGYIKEGVELIDDYAHHPSEIRASLAAARRYTKGRIWCVFQPHTYSRTKALLHEFAEALSLADEVVLAEIYPARETDTLGISSEDLAREIVSLGHNARYPGSFQTIEKFLSENCIHGDLLITMGAGDVYKIGDALLK